MIDVMMLKGTLRPLDSFAFMRRPTTLEQFISTSHYQIYPAIPLSVFINSRPGQLQYV